MLNVDILFSEIGLDMSEAFNVTVKSRDTQIIALYW